jgi:predicted amidohydrolase YtcJ
MLVFSAADFEDFRQPRPDMPAEMEGELEEVVRILAENRWPWRLHATYDETISRALDVFERVDQDIPLEGLNWFFDHAETISDRSIDRIAALGGGIAVQHRMAYQGEYFVERYGAARPRRRRRSRKMLEKGVKVSAGTDATRVASYNPWVSLAWLVTGKTVGGPALTRSATASIARRRCGCGPRTSPGSRTRKGKKGRIEVGQLADPDRARPRFLRLPEAEIADITVRSYGGYAAWAEPALAGMSNAKRVAPSCASLRHCNFHGGHDNGHGQRYATAWSRTLPIADLKGFWGALGCSCWAV